jgi:hypothetical protein
MTLESKFVISRDFNKLFVLADLAPLTSVQLLASKQENEWNSKSHTVLLQGDFEGKVTFSVESCT